MMPSGLPSQKSQVNSVWSVASEPPSLTIAIIFCKSHRHRCSHWACTLTLLLCEYLLQNCEVITGISPSSGIPFLNYSNHFYIFFFFYTFALGIISYSLLFPHPFAFRFAWIRRCNFTQNRRLGGWIKNCRRCFFILLKTKTRGKFRELLKML
jgi:hypothetical protein